MSEFIGETVSMKSVKVHQGDRIKTKEKIAFGMANIGNIPIMTLINAYLLIFYTDVIGLNPASVATLFLIVRVLDGINDPIMGFVIDHLPRTRLGRFRSYLLFGSVICSINYLLLWFGPVWMPGIKLLIVYITYILIGITFDMMDIPLNSLIPVMTDVDKERNSLSSIKGFCYLLGGMVFNIGAPIVLANAVTPLSGYYVLIIAAVVLVMGFSIIGVLGIRERIEPLEQNEKYKLKDVLHIITARPVMATFFTALLFGVASALTNSSNIFFVTYVLNGEIEVISIMLVCSLVGILPSMISSSFLSNRFGRKPVFTAGLLCYGIMPLIRLFSVTTIPLMYVSAALVGVGTGLVLPLMYGIQADNVDYIEHERNQRAEGCLAALNSFVIKSGGGIGGAVSGYILAATGYVANTVQTETARFGIILVTIILPASIMLIAACVFGFGYKLSKEKMSEITSSLRERRAAKRHDN